MEIRTELQHISYKVLAVTGISDVND